MAKSTRLGSSSVPTIDLEGSPSDMGSQHGETCRDQIRELAELRLAFLCRQFGRGAASTVQLVAETMQRAIESQFPDVYAETSATARSADIDYWRLVVAGGLSDVADLVGRKHAQIAGASNDCTLTALRTESSGVVLLGTWDSHAFATQSLAVCRRRPTSAPATLGLTTYGWPLQQAVNSNGVAVTIANMVAGSAGNGAPFIAALVHIAAAASLHEAEGRACGAEHASARYYMLCDPSEYCGIEVVPHTSCLIDRSLPACHTNHFLFDGSTQHEGRKDQLGSSISRLARAIELISELADLESIDAQLRRYADGEIVQRGSGDDDRTGAIFALVPAQQTIYFIRTPEESIVCAKL